jgi:hypothetical protein
LRCRAHNQHAAALAFGRAFMRDKRAEARARRAATSAAATAMATAAATTAAAPTIAESATAAPTIDAGTTGDPVPPLVHGERSPTAAAQTDAMVTANPATAVASRAFDADVTDALRRLGFKAGDVRQAIAGTRNQPASTFEERIRSALAVLTRSRCSDGALDELTRRWGASASSV